jgi:S-DNA-T family DNA segregation ATPase FtsK/SpoIIIE
MNKSELQKKYKYIATDIADKFAKFGCPVKMSRIQVGPTLTVFYFKPKLDKDIVKMKSVREKLNDIFKDSQIQVNGMQPDGTFSCVMPNEVRQFPRLLDYLGKANPSKHHEIPLHIGVTHGGKFFTLGLEKGIHVMVAGTTGSGKSVCMSGMILSILEYTKPEEVSLLLIDPKMTEFTLFDGAPHLLTPVITESGEALTHLNMAVAALADRITFLKKNKFKDLESYNKKHPEKIMPRIVICIDELAQLMMGKHGSEIDEALTKLCALGRAAGIHLIMATQRPSVDVISGLLKMNVPTRLAFYMPSANDSRTILSKGGAEKLLGKGDMLFADSGTAAIYRLQCLNVTDEDIKNYMSKWVLPTLATPEADLYPKRNLS